MSKFYDVQQGSDEWFDLKKGIISSSNFASIMANSINKQAVFNENAIFGNPAQQYAMKIALERVTGKSPTDYNNNWMNRGNELEQEARDEYQIQTVRAVENGGFFVSDKEKNGNGLGEFGTSPDGLIFAPPSKGMEPVKAGTEFKCVKYSTHFKTLQDEYYDKSYTWQMQGQILVANLGFVDWASYCPDFPPEKRLFIYTVMPDPVKQNQLKKRLAVFSKLVKEYEGVLK